MAIYSTPNDANIGLAWHLRRHEVLRAWKVLERAGLPLGSGSVLLAVADAPFNQHPDIPNPTPEYNCETNSSALHSAFDTGGVGYYHGTDMQGVIRAYRNNEVGITGVAPGVACGHIAFNYGLADTVEAIVKAADWGAKAINLSMSPILGTPQQLSDVTAAVAYAMAHDCLVVAAAGNSDASADAGALPQSVDDVVVAGGIGHADARARWNVGSGLSGSTYGAVVDICSAAEDIPLATIDEATFLPTYESWPGTSYAAPTVTAVLGLIHTACAGLTATEARDILYGTMDVARDSSFPTYFPSAGVLNAARAVSKALATDAARAGQIFPHVSFWGTGASTVSVPGSTTTTLSGIVKVDLDAYSSDAVTAVELWVGDFCVYSGPPVTLTGRASNAGSTKATLKLVAKTAITRVEEVLSPDVVCSSLAITSHVRSPLPVPNDPRLSATYFTGASLAWHLIRHDAVRAWRTLGLAARPRTGDPAIKVCVADAGHLPHEDLPDPLPANEWNTETDIGGAFSSYWDADAYSQKYSLDHGQHVEGFIFAKHNNGVGITGISPGVTPVIINTGVTELYLNDLQGITKAADLGSRLVCCSFGPHYNATTQERADGQAAVDYALARGCLPIVAAGNEMIDLAGVTTSIGNAAGAVVVGGVDINDQPSVWGGVGGSNYGSAVDITAAATAIETTEASDYGVQTYAAEDGTSFATPITTAVAALALTAYPGLTATQLRSVLLTAIDGGRGSNYLAKFPNGGVVNASRAVAKALSMDLARAGDIFPHVHFWGAGVTKTLIPGAQVTTLNGAVKIDVAAYSSDAITAIELWVNGVQLYTGPATTLTATAVNSGTPKATLTVIAKTATGSVSETYAPADLVFTSLTVQRSTSTATSPGASMQLTAVAPRVFVSARATSPGASMALTAVAPTVTVTAPSPAPSPGLLRQFYTWDGRAFISAQVKFFNGTSFN